MLISASHAPRRRADLSHPTKNPGDGCRLKGTALAEPRLHISYIMCCALSRNQRLPVYALRGTPNSFRAGCPCDAFRLREIDTWAAQTDEMHSMTDDSPEAWELVDQRTGPEVCGWRNQPKAV